MRTTKRGDTLVNPATGERMTLVRTADDTDGEALRVEWAWSGPGTPPPLHAHPALWETWAVTSGRLGVRVGDERRVLGPGEVVTVVPGTPHRFWNAGTGNLRFTHEVRPAGTHQELFETTFRLAGEGKLTPWGLLTHPTRLALLWELQEGYFVGPPIVVQRLLFGTLARLTRRRPRRARATRAMRATTSTAQEGDTWSESGGG